jgi:tetratricopeptide (TPR) repeat protein
MSPVKHIRYFFLALIFFAACKNKKENSAEPSSMVELNPAYKNLNDSIRQFPSDAALYQRRAVRLTQDNQHELAYADFLKAYTLTPTLNIALPFVANLAILGRNTERITLLESLTQKFPNSEQPTRLLADAYATSGKMDKALFLYNDMIAKDSLDPEILYEKALLLEQLKDTASAITALRKAYSFQGVDTYGLELAHLFAEQKNPRAVGICDYILNRDSSQIMIDPYFIKGIYYANTKQNAKAISQFDSCILRDWKTTDAYLEKGRVYFHMQNYHAALETFNMATVVSNTDADAYFWLGRCYEALHQRDEAVSNYRKAISFDKDFTEARQHIDKLDAGFAHPSH